MNFDQLKQFTTTEMQMSNINEPTMVMVILKRNRNSNFYQIVGNMLTVCLNVTDSCSERHYPNL